MIQNIFGWFLLGAAAGFFIYQMKKVLTWRELVVLCLSATTFAVVVVGGVYLVNI